MTSLLIFHTHFFCFCNTCLFWTSSDVAGRNIFLLYGFKAHSLQYRLCVKLYEQNHFINTNSLNLKSLSTCYIFIYAYVLLILSIILTHWLFLYRFKQTSNFASEVEINSSGDPAHKSATISDFTLGGKKLHWLNGMVYRTRAAVLFDYQFNEYAINLTGEH